MGAWVQNIGFGSDWVTTKATIVRIRTDITDQSKVVCIPVVSNGENRADARNKMGVVAVKTYAARRCPEGRGRREGGRRLQAGGRGRRRVRLRQPAHGRGGARRQQRHRLEYFLAAYRVELAAPRTT